MTDQKEMIPGVVVIDKRLSRPFAVIRVADGTPWLYRWVDGTKSWVSLRACGLWEGFSLVDCLSPEHAALYGIKHDPSIFAEEAKP